MEVEKLRGELKHNRTRVRLFTGRAPTTGPHRFPFFSLVSLQSNPSYSLSCHPPALESRLIISRSFSAPCGHAASRDACGVGTLVGSSCCGQWSEPTARAKYCHRSCVCVCEGGRLLGTTIERARARARVCVSVCMYERERERERDAEDILS